MHTVALSHSRQFDSSTVMFKISVIFSGIKNKIQYFDWVVIWKNN